MIGGKTTRVYPEATEATTALVCQENYLPGGEAEREGEDRSTTVLAREAAEGAACTCFRLPRDFGQNEDVVAIRVRRRRRPSRKYNKRAVVSCPLIKEG